MLYTYEVQTTHPDCAVPQIYIQCEPQDIDNLVQQVMRAHPMYFVREPVASACKTPVCGYRTPVLCVRRGAVEC